MRPSTELLTSHSPQGASLLTRVTSRDSELSMSYWWFRLCSSQSDPGSSDGTYRQLPRNMRLWAGETLKRCMIWCGFLHAITDAVCFKYYRDLIYMRGTSHTEKLLPAPFPVSTFTSPCTSMSKLKQTTDRSPSFTSIRSAKLLLLD